MIISGADEELAHAWANFFIEKSTQEVMNERYGYGCKIMIFNH